MAYDPNKKPINKSRLDDLVMDEEQIAVLLNNLMIGHVATRDHNQPFVIPTTFWYSKEKHEIYFHSNAFGRIRYNANNYSEVCFTCFESGRLLPSNIPLEKSIQYKSIMVFGTLLVIKDFNEKRSPGKVDWKI